MPELPEVETVRRVLSRQVLGHAIANVDGRTVQMRRPLDIARLAREAPGRRLEAARRRGKYLLLDLDPPGTLLLHLGMSGRLLLRGADAPRLPHTHLVLGLQSGPELHLVDPR